MMHDWTIERADPCAPAAPCLSPRERPLDAATKRALARWAQRELGAHGHVWVSEWVSMDSRQTPHELRIRWIADGTAKTATIRAKAEDILRTETMAPPSHLLTYTRNSIA